MAENGRSLLLKLLVANYEELTRYLTKRVGPVSASDALHDTYIRLLQAGTIPDLDNPRAYLFRAASNIALDRLRAGNVANRRLIAADLAPEQASSAPPADIAIEKKERVRLLALAIGELPPRCREIFLLHKIDGLSHSQVAEKLGVSKSTVEKHVMKALAHCRDRLIN